MSVGTATMEFDRRRPPAPVPHVGSLGGLRLYRALRKNSITAWRREAYEEPYIADRNQIGGYVLLNDPELIRRVLVDNVANYPKDRLQLDKLEPAVGRGLLTGDGESWRLQRRTVAPLFQPANVAGYLAPMAASVEEMLARWERYAETATIDIAREMTALTYDIISRTVFSHEIETPPEVMGEAITTYFDALGRIDLWDVLPLPKWLPRPAFIRARPARKIFREEVRRLLDRRRARMAAGQAVPDDLVTRLINARDPEAGGPLADALIHDNLVTFIGAGHETTANALAWTLFLLSEFPDADGRLAAEVKSLDDGLPDADALARLSETRMILEESMRLYPPVPFMSREALGPDRLGDCAVGPRTRILIAPWVLHRHRKLWPDADLFRPERFAPERRAKIPRFAYLPFGAGARICVGATFAMQEALLALAMIARRFKLTLVEGTRVMPFARMTLRTANGLPMRIARR